MTIKRSVARMGDIPSFDFSIFFMPDFSYA